MVHKSRKRGKWTTQRGEESFDQSPENHVALPLGSLRVCCTYVGPSDVAPLLIPIDRVDRGHITLLVTPCLLRNLIGISAHHPYPSPHQGHIRADFTFCRVTPTALLISGTRVWERACARANTRKFSCQRQSGGGPRARENAVPERRIAN